MRNLENLNSYTLLTTFYQSWIPIIQNLISLFSKILLQAEAHRKAKEEAVVSHHEKMKLEILKQKARQDQTAVASPEVKKHLADFVLAKKRKEASAWTSPGPTSSSAVPRSSGSRTRRSGFPFRSKAFVSVWN